MSGTDAANAEMNRLREDAGRKRNWKRWGAYLSERQWGTVREDYSPDGYFDAETGQGLGASHQTGWTSLIVRCIEDVAKKQKT